MACCQLRWGTARLVVDGGRSLNVDATFCTAISSAEEKVERMCGMEQQGGDCWTLG